MELDRVSETSVQVKPITALRRMAWANWVL